MDASGSDNGPPIQYSAFRGIEMIDQAEQRGLQGPPQRKIIQLSKRGKSNELPC